MTVLQATELTGQQCEQLCDALCAAFDDDALQQMVRFKLGGVLYNLVKPGPLKTVVFQLVQLAGREGWTEALIRAACVSRPNHPKVQAFVEQCWPEAQVPQDPAQQAVRVRVGLEALTEIVRRLADPTLRRIIGRFDADFDMTCAKAQALGRYKALHDHLHHLGTKYLRSMTDAAALCRQNEAQYQLLESYALQLQADAGRARQVAAGLPSGRVENDWIDALEQAAASVQQSLDGDDDAPLQRGLLALRRVLVEEPTRINALLCEAAGDLRLPQLAQALGEIRGRLDQVPADDPGELLQDFEEGLNNLLLLRPRLAGLVEEHFEWQWLDKELAAADSFPGITPEDRFPRWRTFRERLLRLCALGAAREWARDLDALLQALEQAGAARDATQFGRRYNKFRTVAADRFFNLDAELRDLSDQLARIAQPLNQLLRFATDGSN